MVGTMVYVQWTYGSTVRLSSYYTLHSIWRQPCVCVCVCVCVTELVSGWVYIPYERERERERVWVCVCVCVCVVQSSRDGDLPTVSASGCGCCLRLLYSPVYSGYTCSETDRKCNTWILILKCTAQSVALVWLRVRSTCMCVWYKYRLTMKRRCIRDLVPRKPMFRRPEREV